MVLPKKKMTSPIHSTVDVLNVSHYTKCFIIIKDMFKSILLLFLPLAVWYRIAGGEKLTFQDMPYT